MSTAESDLSDCSTTTGTTHCEFPQFGTHKGPQFFVVVVFSKYSPLTANVSIYKNIKNIDGSTPVLIAGLKRPQ